MKQELVECIANFSEGHNEETIAEICRAVQSAGASLLDNTRDPDHNRCVVTFAGQPEHVLQGAVGAVGIAVQRINLSEHRGVHPRIGAADVVPFVPLSGFTMEQSVRLAEAAGEEIWQRFGVPVYLYEAAARDPERVRLENIRKPGFEGKPDIGSGRHPTAGATVVGARRLLVAWNINLADADLELGRRIARSIRASSGGFAGVKALGLPLASRGAVQVSMNVTDIESAPLHLILETVTEQAQQARARVLGSELIGLIPQRAIDLTDGHEMHWLNWSDDKVLETRLRNSAPLQ